MALLITDDDLPQLLSMRAENLPRHHFYAQGQAGTFFMRDFQGALPKLNVAGYTHRHRYARSEATPPQGKAFRRISSF